MEMLCRMTADIFRATTAASNADITTTTKALTTYILHHHGKRNGDDDNPCQHDCPMPELLLLMHPLYT